MASRFNPLKADAAWQKAWDDNRTFAARDDSPKPKSQEGRGIGLINKLRAYALQDQGFDTVDANTRLGFAVDARNFATAAKMLTLLGQRRVRLLTNNPDKVAALEAAGVTVAERVPHVLPANPHNERYLATKRDRTGHQF